jgi:hypothetical protein
MILATPGSFVLICRLVVNTAFLDIKEVWITLEFWLGYISKVLYIYVHKLGTKQCMLIWVPIFFLIQCQLFPPKFYCHKLWIMRIKNWVSILFCCNLSCFSNFVCSNIWVLHKYWTWIGVWSSCHVPRF